VRMGGCWKVLNEEISLLLPQYIFKCITLVAQCQDDTSISKFCDSDSFLYLPNLNILFHNSVKCI
jgi:hypothetical protein